jgi:alpha-beta hydrolase superfamily lysophospholipase
MPFGHTHLSHGFFMSPVSFTRDQAELLKAALPGLAAIGHGPGVDTGNPLVQAYCAHYGLDFSLQYPDMVHVLGTVSAVGFRIATQYWIPPQARGTLVVVHGYYDHVGIYNKVIAFALAQGLAVLAFDLPGHGLSSGEAAVIDSFDQYGDVLEAILLRTRALLPSPFHVLGQSTGGAVVLNHLWRYESVRAQPVFERIALCAPLILPRDWQRGRIAYALLHRFISYLPRGHSRSSHDPQFLRFIDEQDCLQSTRLSVRWVGAMKAWDQEFRGWAPLARELLVIQGSDDQTVDWRYNLAQIRQQLPAAKVLMIEDAGHQLVNEREDFREQVFVALRDYFCTMPSNPLPERTR